MANQFKVVFPIFTERHKFQLNIQSDLFNEIIKFNIQLQILFYVSAELTLNLVNVTVFFHKLLG